MQCLVCVKVEVNMAEATTTHRLRSRKKRKSYSREHKLSVLGRVLALAREERFSNRVNRQDLTNGAGFQLLA